MHFEPTFITPGALPLWLDIGAVALGAIFGATLANSRQAPLLGVLLVGILLGFGGSMIRDILLNTEISSIALCVLLRGMAIWRGWEAPHADHLKPNTWIKRKPKEDSK